MDTNCENWLADRLGPFHTFLSEWAVFSESLFGPSQSLPLWSPKVNFAIRSPRPGVGVPLVWESQCDCQVRSKERDSLTVPGRPLAVEMGEHCGIGYPQKPPRDYPMWPPALLRAAGAAAAAEWLCFGCQWLLSLGGLATLLQARQGKTEGTQGISDGFFPS